MIHQQTGDVGKSGHVAELQQRPLPRSGFGSGDDLGWKALHGEYVEDQQTPGGGGGEELAAVLSPCLTEYIHEQLRFLLALLTQTIHNGEGGDDHLAGGKGGENPHADAPVVAEGADRRFDPAADAAEE